ncbi:MAG: hypothetical protein SWK90_17090 [Chloroflexota bacterium]|nr:hypothetical protein [Chloroflexota bacterium]
MVCYLEEGQCWGLEAHGGLTALALVAVVEVAGYERSCDRDFGYLS